MFHPTLFSRRDALKTASCGFGYLALAGLAAEAAAGEAPPARLPHVLPKAKRIIFLFMQGGVSQVDSFDYKPLLERENGKTMSFDDARILANTGARGLFTQNIGSLLGVRQACRPIDQT